MARTAMAVHPRDETPPAEVERLAAVIEEDGGAALAAYRDPVGGHWQLFALLPRAKVQPTPYQRDLSKAHAERLLKVIKKIDRFVDPVVAVRSGDGYWTPNGNHRRFVLEKLKAALVPAIVVPEAEVAFQILALNTEKAHNLKEKSLEVIRMVRGLIDGGSRKDEEAYSFQFEEPHFITLGLLYEKHARFAGGAYAPFLRRVDKFLKEPIKGAYAIREKRAARVEEADGHLKKAVDALKRRGLNHPFMKNYVLARCNPLSRARKTVPKFEQAIALLVDNLAAFDPQKVRQEDIARSAVLSIPAAS
jgi:ParB family chromosome partitioning protein